MILDQFELLSKYDEGLYQIEKAGCSEVVNFARAKEFVLEFWRQFVEDGKELEFKIVPLDL